MTTRLIPYRSLGLLFVLGIATVTLSSTGYAQSTDNGGDKNRNAPVSPLSVIQVPGNPITSADISWADSGTERYYFAVIHGYLHAPDGTFTVVDPPESSEAVAQSINQAGKSLATTLSGSPWGFMAFCELLMEPSPASMFQLLARASPKVPSAKVLTRVERSQGLTLTVAM